MKDINGNELAYKYEPAGVPRQNRFINNDVEANGNPVDAPFLISSSGAETYYVNSKFKVSIQRDGLITYSCGPDPLSAWELEKFPNWDFISYFYEIGDYCGSGAMIGIKGNLAVAHDMGHCSCYGPVEEIKFDFVDIAKVLTYDVIDPQTGIERSLDDYDYQKWFDVTALAKKAYA